jgi:hypothetical protein
MKGLIKFTLTATASALALWFPAGAGADTQWICTVEGVPTVFVTASDAAKGGLTRANLKAGAVFERQFGEENCHVTST